MRVRPQDTAQHRGHLGRTDGATMTRGAPAFFQRKIEIRALIISVHGLRVSE